MTTLSSLLFLTGGFMVGFVAAMVANSWCSKFKSEAVKRGYAEWLVNPKNGTTTWKWRDK